MSTVLTINSGNNPVPINCGAHGAVVTNKGGSTVYYAGTQTVTTSSSSLTSSSSATLQGAKFFWLPTGSATLTVVDVRGRQEDPLSFTGDVSATGKFLATGGLGVGNSAAATESIGKAVVKKIEVFDDTGTSLGFVPVYSSIT